MSAGALDARGDFFYFFHFCHDCFMASTLFPLNTSSYSKCSSHYKNLNSTYFCLVSREKIKGSVCTCAGEHLNKCIVFVQKKNPTQICPALFFVFFLSFTFKYFFYRDKEYKGRWSGWQACGDYGGWRCATRVTDGFTIIWEFTAQKHA